MKNFIEVRISNGKSNSQLFELESIDEFISLLHEWKDKEVEIEVINGMVKII